MKELIDLSVDARWIVPMKKDDDQAGNQRVLERHTIGVLNGKIKVIMPTDIFYEHFYAATKLDLSISQQVLMPGLINCHSHVGMTLLRGYVDDKSMETWLSKYIWPTEMKYVSKEFVKQGAILAAHEMLRTGTTMTNDMYYEYSTTAKVFKESNIRIVTGPVLMDVGPDSEVANKQLQHIRDVARQLKQTESLNDNPLNVYADDLDEDISVFSDPLVRFAIAPHATYTCNTARLAEVSSILDESAIRESILHIHLNETKHEVSKFLDVHNYSGVDSLAKANALSSKLLAAHCVCMTQKELEIFKENKANVCHCPRSNMKLGSGIADVETMHLMGINVCLGTDSACSNNSLDILLEAQTACMLAKVKTCNAAACDAYTALKMATINGAIALQREHDLGSLEVGKLCDMIAVDIGAPENQPVFDPISHLVYTHHKKVEYVWVRGKMVVEKGKVLTVKLDMNAVEQWRQELNSFRKKIKQFD